MTLLLTILLSLHVLSTIFWAGSTFVLARSNGSGSEPLFRPQMGAAVVAFLSGAALWLLLRGASFASSDTVLTVGIVAAVVAAGVQGALKARPARAHRIAAGLL